MRVSERCHAATPETREFFFSFFPLGRGERYGGSLFFPQCVHILYNKASKSPLGSLFISFSVRYHLYPACAVPSLPGTGAERDGRSGLGRRYHLSILFCVILSLWGLHV